MASNAEFPGPPDLGSASPSVARLLTALGARAVHLLLTHVRKPE